MSDLRLNYSKTSFQTILDILSDLARVQNDKRYVIRGWGKGIKNYGLKQKDFDEIDSHRQTLFKSTTSQFKNYKIDLENFRFIEVYDKTNRVKRGPYYSISPLGLLFLLKFQKQFTVNSTIEMFSYFSRIGLNKNYGIKNESWKFFNNKQINMAMKTIFKNIDFDYINDKLIMTLYMLNPKSFNKIALTQITSTKTYIKVTKPKSKKFKNIVTLNQLDFGLAYHFRNLLVYYLIMKLKMKEVENIPKDFRLFFGLIISSIQKDSITDFIESGKNEIQVYEQSFSPKEMSLMINHELKRVIDQLT